MDVPDRSRTDDGERVIHDFRRLVRQRLGSVALAVLDTRLDGGETKSLVGLASLGSPGRWTVKKVGLPDQGRWRGGSFRAILTCCGGWRGRWRTEEEQSGRGGLQWRRGRRSGRAMPSGPHRPDDAFGAHGQIAVRERSGSKQWSGRKSLSPSALDGIPRRDETGGPPFSSAIPYMSTVPPSRVSGRHLSDRGGAGRLDDDVVARPGLCRGAPRAKLVGPPCQSPPSYRLHTDEARAG